MNTDGTQDTYLRSWYDTDSRLVLDERGTTILTQPCSAPLKFTRQFRSNLDSTIHFGVVWPGAENVLDINDRSSVVLDAQEWIIEGSKYGFTCKGASYLSVSGLVRGRGKECDVDFGNYSDQWPRGRSTGRLNLVRADGSPIRVRCLQAAKPTLVPGSGPYEFLFPHPDAWYHDLTIEGFLLLRRNKLVFK
jgi:hypothetical protein